MPAFDDAREFWDARFAAPEYIFGTTPNRFLESQAAEIPGGAKVLDVACGEGRNAVWLAQRGCAVTGLDISPLALDKARRLAADHAVTVDWQLGDLREFRWADGAFDAIVCIFIQFASPAERAQLFEGFRRALKPGGVLLMQGYTPKQLEFRTGGAGDVAHLYTAALLRDAFAGWELLRLVEHEAELAEGTKHVGRSALIDLVARKPA